MKRTVDAKWNGRREAQAEPSKTATKRSLHGLQRLPRKRSASSSSPLNSGGISSNAEISATRLQSSTRSERENGGKFWERGSGGDKVVRLGATWSCCQLFLSIYNLFINKIILKKFYNYSNKFTKKCLVNVSL